MLKLTIFLASAGFLTAAPQVVSTSPGDGKGETAIVGATYYDALGAANVVWTHILVDAGQNGATGCFIWFWPNASQPSSSLIWLSEDNGITWNQSVTPGSAAIADNSRCKLTGSGSSVQFSADGTKVTLQVSLTFKPAFAGTKTISAYAMNNQGYNSGWYTGGSLQAIAPYPRNWVGYHDSATCSLISGWAVDYNHGEAVYVDFYDGASYLQTVLASAFRPDGGIGNHGFSFATPASVKDNAIHTIHARFGGTNQELASARTLGPCVEPAPNMPVVSTITNGQSKSAIFKAVLTDPSGQVDIKAAHILVSTSANANGANACFTYYYRPTHQILLADDTGTALLPGTLTPGATPNQTLSNSTCTISSVGSSAQVTSTSGGTNNSFTVALNLTFLAGTPVGTMENVYGYVWDYEDLTAGWTAPVQWQVPAALPTPPTVWKGITYSPKGHPLYKMLRDWASDPSIATAVDQDFNQLTAAGFNLVHIYLWDKRVLDWACVTYHPSCNLQFQDAGFTSASTGSNDPSQSAFGQFDSLKQFVQKAEQHGLYVALHFANGRLALDHDNALNVCNAADSVINPIVNEFVSWVEGFIDGLAASKNHILLWGLNFTLAPWPIQTYSCGPQNLWAQTEHAKSRAFRRIYHQLDMYIGNQLMQPLPAVRTLGLMGVDLVFSLTAPEGFNLAYDSIPRDTAYAWDVNATQQSTANAIASVKTNLRIEYGSPLLKDADIYMLQLYNANTVDLSAALQNVPIADKSRIFVVEFATSNSVSNTSRAINIPSFGDANTPTTTAAGQAQWTLNTLCAFKNANLTKYAYWSMYDQYNLWAGQPFNDTGQALAWDGFWGAFDDISGAQKPVWNTLATFTPNSVCPAGSPRPPVLSLTLADTYYTHGQSVQATWTAADVTSLAIVPPSTGVVKSCSPNPNNGGLPKALSLSGIVVGKLRFRRHTCKWLRLGERGPNDYPHGTEHGEQLNSIGHCHRLCQHKSRPAGGLRCQGQYPLHPTSSRHRGHRFHHGMGKWLFRQRRQLGPTDTARLR